MPLGLLAPLSFPPALGVPCVWTAWLRPRIISTVPSEAASEGLQELLKRQEIKFERANPNKIK